ANTTRSTRAHSAVARHMGHGSHELYSTAPGSQYAATSWQAARIATTSACALGSRSTVTRFVPSPTAWPSRTTTAPNGPCPDGTPVTASSTARVSHCSSDVMLPMLPQRGGPPVNDQEPPARL